MLIECFAGIKAGRLAVDRSHVQVVGDFSSEVDEFALRIQDKCWPDHVKLGDITKVSESDLSRALKPFVGSIDAFLITSGFPCKDTSRLKSGRLNLDGPQSGLFSFFLRIYEWTVRIAMDTPVKFIVENTMMDVDAMDQVSRTLSCTPLRINAGRVCGASRDRLYWINWEFCPRRGEELTHGEHFTEITLLPAKQPEWISPGWHLHRDFPGLLPCITGYVRKDKPFTKPVGLGKASNTARSRWESDNFATQVYHYEDEVLLWPDDRLATSNLHGMQFNEGGRLPAAEELEAVMGFDRGYTCLDQKRREKGDYDARRNALGNSFAVPVIQRLVLSLLVGRSCCLEPCPTMPGLAHVDRPPWVYPLPAPNQFPYRFEGACGPPG